MQHVWVMSQCYKAPSGEVLPVAWSYCANHSAMGYQSNGWGLVWVSLVGHQLEFLLSGTEDRVEVVGQEDEPPTTLLLSTYADQLGAGDYPTLKSVLRKLAQTEPRFMMDRDPRRA